MPAHSHSPHVENLMVGTVGGSIALFEGAAWLLPHFGLLTLPQTLALCLGCGLALGLHLSRQPG